MAAFSTFLRFLKWKIDGKWKTVATDSSNSYDATTDFLEADFWPGIRNMSVTPCLNTRVAGTQAALKMCY
jgi:hypothetical protein